MNRAFYHLRVKVCQGFYLLLLPGLLILSLTLISCSADTQNTGNQANGLKTKVVHIGYQSSGDLVRITGVLEKRLQSLGVSVQWSQFAAGPQLMEAMNVGKIDVGSVGETPPIFAQAAGTNLVYIASNKPSAGTSSGIVVQNNSPIRSVAELKGQKIIFQRGSGSHYLLVKALEEVGLKYSDVQALSLPPSEASAAFSQQKIDAWVTWDPYLALAQITGSARLLRDGSGISTQGGFYIAARKFATENSELVQLILEEIDKLGKWAENNPSEVVKLIAPQIKLDEEILTLMVKRRTYGLRPITPTLMENQQRIADLFAEQKIIPKPINIQEVTLTAEEYAAITPNLISQR